MRIGILKSPLFFRTVLCGEILCRVDDVYCKKFYVTYQDLIEKYKRSVKEMVNNSFPGQS